MKRSIFKSIFKPNFRFFGDSKTITFYFENKDSSLTEVEAQSGDNLLEIAHQNDIDLEGACDMQLACSTCHVVLDEDLYLKLNEPQVREEDMLDLAPGLTRTSRLACQIKITESFEHTKVKLPNVTRNFYVDGFVPKPH